MSQTGPTTRRQPVEGLIRWAARLGLAGAVLGVAAGIVQILAGAQIPEWSGNKANPGGLGALTVMLSGVAAGCALLLRRPTLSYGGRLGCATGLLVFGAVCFSTVGALWWLPGLLLLGAAVLAIAGAGVRALPAALSERWLSVLISACGCLMCLMAAGAEDPVLLVVGGVGGLALIAAPWVRGTVLRLVLLLAGTIPFTVLTWWSLVPLVLTALVLGMAAVTFRPGVSRAGPERADAGRAPSTAISR